MGHLKQKIQNVRSDLRADKQMLILSETVLQDDQLLGELALSDEGFIICIVIAELEAAHSNIKRAAVVMGAIALAGAAGVGVPAAMLGYAGFTALGPAAGSIAASWMSSIAIGNGIGVVTGSAYAVLQSAAMGGVAGTYMAAASATVFGAAGGATAVAYTTKK